MKYTEEKLKELCSKHNVEYIGNISKLNKSGNKPERYIQFICPEHKQFGVQERKVFDFGRLKKICQYCNHSNLKDILQDEVDKVNGNVQILSEYKSWRTKVDCACRVCGNTWSTVVSVLLYGGGCPKCGRIKANANEMRSEESIISEIESANTAIKIVGKYRGYHAPIECKCKIDGCEWGTSDPAHLISGDANCPECTKRKMHERFALSQNDFTQRISEIFDDNIVVIGEYINANTPIELYCKKHDNHFTSVPRNLLYSKTKGCPLCSQSMGEAKMMSILKEFGYNIIPQYTFDDCVYVNKLRFDGYDEDNNIAFEYQGEQHYRPVDFGGYGQESAEEQFVLNQTRDQIKEEYCKSNGIPLIKIPYWEFDNMGAFLMSELNNINNTH